MVPEVSLSSRVRGTELSAPSNVVPPVVYRGEGTFDHIIVSKSGWECPCKRGLVLFTITRP